MVLGLILSLSLLAYWLSRKLYRAYVYFVSREERTHRRDLVRRHLTDGTAIPAHHLGPKCFLALDVVLLGTVAHCLWRLLELDNGAAGGDQIFGPFAVFSVVAALGMMRAGRELLFFYEEMSRAAAGQRRTGETPLFLSDDRRATAVGRHFQWWEVGAVLWASMPILLLVFGRDDAIHSHGSTLRLAAIFCTWFVAPQVILGVTIARSIWPVRRVIYRS